MKVAFAIGHTSRSVRAFYFLALSISAISLSAQTPNADLLLLNAHVVTMNDKQPSAQAIAIQGERIVWVGNSDEGKKLYPSARVMDLHGTTVLPGLIDAHPTLSI
jgi:imidazolonepropionase-like amidohydrolase